MGVTSVSMWMFSWRMACNSSCVAAICASPRRYIMLTLAFGPNNRREVRAQSTAVKPPPMTITSPSICTGRRR